MGGGGGGGGGGRPNAFVVVSSAVADVVSRTDGAAECANACVNGQEQPANGGVEAMQPQDERGNDRRNGEKAERRNRPVGSMRSHSYSWPVEAAGRIR